MPAPLKQGDAVVFSTDYLKALQLGSSRDAVRGWTGIVTETNAWIDEDSVPHPPTTAVVQWTHPIPTDLPIHDGQVMDAKDYVPATETSGWNVTDLQKA